MPYLCIPVATNACYSLSLSLTEFDLRCGQAKDGHGGALLLPSDAPFDTRPERAMAHFEMECANGAGRRGKPNPAC